MYVLGHRGTGVTLRSIAQELKRRAAGLKGPENTLKALEIALQNGADGLEFDVIATADDDLAVIHSQALNLHVTGAVRKRRNLGYVKNHTMAQLGKMDVGDGEPIPSLRDVFNLAARYNYPVLNIDLTGKGTYALAYKQAKQSGYPMDKIIFSSFDHDQLLKLRALDPDIKIGLLFSDHTKLPGRKKLSTQYIDSVLQTIKPTSIHPIISSVTQDIIDYARQKKLEIYAWTRREKHPDNDRTVLDFARAHKDSADIHLITDYPAEIKNNL